MASASRKLLRELPTNEAMLKILHDLGEDTDHAIAIIGDQRSEALQNRIVASRDDF